MFEQMINFPREKQQQFSDCDDNELKLKNFTPFFGEAGDGGGSLEEIYFSLITSTTLVAEE